MNKGIYSQAEKETITNDMKQTAETLEKTLDAMIKTRANETQTVTDTANATLLQLHLDVSGTAQSLNKTTETMLLVTATGINSDSSTSTQWPTTNATDLINKATTEYQECFEANGQVDTEKLKQFHTNFTKASQTFLHSEQKLLSGTSTEARETSLMSAINTIREDTQLHQLEVNLRRTEEQISFAETHSGQPKETLKNEDYKDPTAIAYRKNIEKQTVYLSPAHPGPPPTHP